MQKYRCFFNQIHFLMFKMPFFFIHFYISTHIFTSLPSLREKQKSLTGQRKRPSPKNSSCRNQPSAAPRFFHPRRPFFPTKIITLHLCTIRPAAARASTDTTQPKN